MVTATAGDVPRQLSSASTVSAWCIVRCGSWRTGQSPKACTCCIVATIHPASASTTCSSVPSKRTGRTCETRDGRNMVVAGVRCHQLTVLTAMSTHLRTPSRPQLRSGGSVASALACTCGPSECSMVDRVGGGSVATARPDGALRATVPIRRRGRESQPSTEASSPEHHVPNIQPRPPRSACPHAQS